MKMKFLFSLILLLLLVSCGGGGGVDQNQLIVPTPATVTPIPQVELVVSSDMITPATTHQVESLTSGTVSVLGGDWYDPELAAIDGRTICHVDATKTDPNQLSIPVCPSLSGGAPVDISDSNVGGGVE